MTVLEGWTNNWWCIMIPIYYNTAAEEEIKRLVRPRTRSIVSINLMLFWFSLNKLKALHQTWHQPLIIYGWISKHRIQFWQNKTFFQCKSIDKVVNDPHGIIGKGDWCASSSLYLLIWWMNVKRKVEEMDNYWWSLNFT